MNAIPVDQIAIPEDRYYCDLCKDYRPKQPRAFGVNFLPTGHWACPFCIEEYRIRLVAGTWRRHATRT